MWQRFCDQARKVVFYAQEEAQRFREGYVSTEHLLLGLCRDESTTAAKTLDLLGINLVRIRTEVEKVVSHGKSPPSQDMTLTPRAKRVVDLAYDEARNFDDNFIGTEHLLLGLISEGDGLAGRALAKLGVTLGPARNAVCKVREVEGNPVPSPRVSVAENPFPWPESEALEDAVGQRLKAYREQIYGVDLLALVLLADEGVLEMLRTAGVSTNKLATFVEGKLLERAALLAQGQQDLSALKTGTLFKVIELGQVEARSSGMPMDSKHVLIGMIEEGQSVLAAYLDGEKFDIRSLRSLLKASREQ